eukprot:SAG11_NODE_26_length_23420_cov_40.459886_3_plen_207_part_00
MSALGTDLSTKPDAHAFWTEKNNFKEVRSFIVVGERVCPMMAGEHCLHHTPFSAAVVITVAQPLVHAPGIEPRRKMNAAASITCNGVAEISWLATCVSPKRKTQWRLARSCASSAIERFLFRHHGDETKDPLAPCPELCPFRHHRDAGARDERALPQAAAAAASCRDRDRTVATPEPDRQKLASKVRAPLVRLTVHMPLPPRRATG